MKQRKSKLNHQHNIRRERLLAELPLHDWNIPRAGLAAGYSRQYAMTRLAYYIEKDVEFCRRMDEKKVEIRQESTDKAQKLVQELEKIISGKGETTTNRLRAIELHMKHLGLLAERRIIENVDRQRELSEAEVAEAKRLAQIRLRKTG